MGRDSRIEPDALRRTRQGSGTTTIFVAAGFFGIVMGALFYVNRQTDHAADSSTASVSRTADEQSADPRETSASDPVAALFDVGEETARTSRPMEIVDEESVEPFAAATAIVEESAVHPQTVDRSEAEARRDRLTSQLEAGEFGPALELAQSVSDADERAELLQLVADAQMKLGEFDGALASIRRIPVPEQRREARGRRAAQQALAGGSMADFEPLIELIQQETSGPWEEIDGVGGTISSFETGVRVDPNGLLYRLTKQEHSGRLERLGIQARKADLNEDMARPSNLRLISLTRLEKAAAERLAQGQPVLETMKHLAGLSEIRYVFLYPEAGEIVIGGPAEAWQYNEHGLPVGVDSGRPTLQLDDFVTVLRTFSPEGLGMFNCLIVPRQAGLKAVKDYVEQSNARGPISSGRVRHWVRQLQERLGLQDVVVNGVPADSRVARVIVEADYRMKLIGIGRMDGGPEIPSFFDLLPQSLQQNPPEMDALRWWMTMKYDAVMHSPDRNVFEIQGSSVLCLSENELITNDGERVATGKAEATNRLFAENFTQHYQDLARRDIVFADMQNIFDLALVAALIQNERLADRIGWDLGAFAAHGTYRPAAYDVPQTVMSVVNHRVYNGRDIVVQVAGGVRADLMSVVQDDDVLKEAERLQSIVGRGKAPELPEGRWWWDAAE